MSKLGAIKTAAEVIQLLAQSYRELTDARRRRDDQGKIEELERRVAELEKARSS